MKRFLIGSTALLVLTFSCRKNTDLTTVSNELPPAEEVIQAKLIGTVTDDLESTLQDAKVELSQESNRVGEVFTNARGEFELSTLVAPGEPIYMQISKAGFATNIMRLDDLANGASTQVQARMMPSEGRPNASEPVSPDTNTIVVYGRLVEPAGALSRNLIMLETLDGRFAYAYSNREGAFRIVAPKDQSFNLTVTDPNCDVELSSGQFGPFDMDAQLDDINIQSLQNDLISLSGQLVDCEDQPVTGGIVFINTGKRSFSAWTNETGNFSFSFSSCLLGESKNLIIRSFDATQENFSPIQSINISQSNTDLGTFQVCTEGEVLIELNVGDSTIIFDNLHQILLDEAGGTVSVTSLSSEKGLAFVIPGIDPGSYQPLSLQITDLPSRLILLGGERYAESGPVEVTLNTVEANFIEGTLDGLVLNPQTGELIPVSGSFSISTKE